MEEELEKLECKNIQIFSLKDRSFQAKVVSVYDGDTITAVFKLFDLYYKWQCRLDGIDTPEIKSKNPDEKKLAVAARDFLREKLLDHVVTLKCDDFDKYGRLLVQVYLKDENLNSTLIDQNFAKKYDGGTKEKWCE